jgi:class 3 adenylate cyclase/quercetin dioxygenase-like cupin family protein
VHLRRKRFERSDETRRVPLAQIDLVELGEAAIGRAIFEPGWRWSEHVKEIVGTESCEVHHLGYVLSGRIHIEMDDGASMELSAGDAFEIPPGHDAWVIGDEPWVSVDFAGRRLFAKAPTELSERVFATIVFTDLSGSTETLGRIGDTNWRTLLAEHNQEARAQIERFGGREIQTTGDGFYLMFDSPVSALRAASAMLHVAARHGLVARAGVHTGEIERNGDDLRGIAVHLAARVLSAAGPGQVVVSSTVRDLVAGSGLRFEDLGEFELKGIDGPRRLAALMRE